MRRALVGKVRNTLANEWGERVFIGLADRLPWARPLVYGLTPQPENYAASDERIVSRYGLRFRVRPHHYFQWHHLFKRQDAILDELLRRGRDQRVFIDVGANIGLYSLVVRQVMRRDARVLAVEPSSATAAALREHVAWSAQSGVEVFECALSSRLGSAQLVERLDDWGKASLARKVEGQTESTVETRTLDDLVRETGVDVVDLVKIDVEGHELEVLKGAKNTIERFLPTIFIEYSPQWMSDAAIVEMTSYFEQLVRRGLRRISDLTGSSRCVGRIRASSDGVAGQPRFLRHPGLRSITLQRLRQTSSQYFTQRPRAVGASGRSPVVRRRSPTWVDSRSAGPRRVRRRSRKMNLCVSPCTLYSSGSESPSSTSR